MCRIKVVFLIACLTLVQCSLLAQNNTNSPYARYGYGVLADQASGGQRGMGGIGYGLRNPKMINLLNPAAFSSVDSMTFMFDMGVTGQLSWLKDQSAKERNFNGNIDYVAMQFPLYKNLGMGVGFKPISYVGYESGTASSVQGYSDLYSGSGGLSQVYGAISYDVFDRFSLGVSLGYLFGDIKYNSVKNFTDVTTYRRDLVDTMRASGFTFEAGFQYVHPLSDASRLVVGGVYSPKIKFSEKVIHSDELLQYTSGGWAIANADRTVSTDEKFEMPQSFGLGASYQKFDKLTVGADFLMQQWADAEFFGKTDTLSNRTKFNAGAEYVIDSRSRNFFKRMHYRAGGHYADSYIKVQGSGYKEYGLSAGFGIPMLDNRSMLNVTFEYMAIRPQLKTLIDEKYFKFTVSYTFNELWFFKRKVQ